MHWSYHSLALSHRLEHSLAASIGILAAEENGWLVAVMYFCALEQDCSNSIANALELPQSCTKPWVGALPCYINWHSCRRGEWLACGGGVFVWLSKKNKTAVTPLLMLWSYRSLTLSHQLEQSLAASIGILAGEENGWLVALLKHWSYHSLTLSHQLEHSLAASIGILAGEENGWLVPPPDLVCVFLAY